AQLLQFSKRSVEIEAWLERAGIHPTSPAMRMAWDHWASLATRPDKDPSLTPRRLRGRWEREATEVDLPMGDALVARVCGRPLDREPPSEEQVIAHLLDPEVGLCAHEARFGEP